MGINAVYSYTLQNELGVNSVLLLCRLAMAENKKLFGKSAIKEKLPVFGKTLNCALTTYL